MSTRTRIDSEQILAIATQIENDNTKLQDLLKQSKAALDGLSSSWTGTAADTSRNAYDAFAGKYFQQYHDVLEQYVTFLRRNISEGYVKTEEANTRLADLLD